MADGPLDYGSGGFFESQKDISDRRAERGFPPNPGDGHSGGSSTRAGVGSGGGGGSLVATLLLGALILMFKLAVAITPLMLKLMWQIAKLVGYLFKAILSGGKRR